MAKQDEQAVLFEVFDKEGNRVEWSESRACVFDKETFYQRLKDGQTMKMNGKSVKKYETLLELMKTGRS